MLNYSEISLYLYETGKHQEGRECQLLVGSRVPGSPVHCGRWGACRFRCLEKSEVPLLSQPSRSWLFTPEKHLLV